MRTIVAHVPHTTTVPAAGVLKPGVVPAGIKRQLTTDYKRYHCVKICSLFHHNFTDTTLFDPPEGATARSHVVSGVEKPPTASAESSVAAPHKNGCYENQVGLLHSIHQLYGSSYFSKVYICTPVRIYALMLHYNV